MNAVHPRACRMPVADPSLCHCMPAQGQHPNAHPHAGKLLSGLRPAARPSRGRRQRGRRRVFAARSTATVAAGRGPPPKPAAAAPITIAHVCGLVRQFAVPIDWHCPLLIPGRAKMQQSRCHGAPRQAGIAHTASLFPATHRAGRVQATHRAAPAPEGSARESSLLQRTAAVTAASIASLMLVSAPQPLLGAQGLGDAARRAPACDLIARSIPPPSPAAPGALPAGCVVSHRLHQHLARRQDRAPGCLHTQRSSRDGSHHQLAQRRAGATGAAVQPRPAGVPPAPAPPACPAPGPTLDSTPPCKCLCQIT
jgi:hypothetical protein